MEHKVESGMKQSPQGLKVYYYEALFPDTTLCCLHPEHKNNSDPVKIRQCAGKYGHTGQALCCPA